MANNWLLLTIFMLLFVTTMSFKSKRVPNTNKAQLPIPFESRLQAYNDMGALKTSEQNWVVIFFSLFSIFVIIYLMLK